MRKVAKPQVLTEGEITHLANFAGSAIELLSFSRRCRHPAATALLIAVGQNDRNQQRGSSWKRALSANLTKKREFAIDRVGGSVL